MCQIAHILWSDSLCLTPLLIPYWGGGGGGGGGEIDIDRYIGALCCPPFLLDCQEGYYITITGRGGIAGYLVYTQYINFFDAEVL